MQNKYSQYHWTTTTCKEMKDHAMTGSVKSMTNRMSFFHHNMVLLKDKKIKLLP